ncbi:Translation initiation factor IF-3 [[Mycoplasma] cavipharyngis]|uniref:translation initiation factor IF-3 n=1 Tax=[Mycoplasma] cavipharyngis TaxID=92757 RepID=UPI003703BE72
MALPISIKKNIPPKKRALTNNQIYHKRLILINSNGEKIGEIATSEALEMAQAQDLDLVVINERSNPVIAKIMDYGKYLYEQKQKLQESKRKSNSIKVKSINIKPQISNHDLLWKSNQAINWLKNGDRVQFVIKTYGRIATKTELIYQTYEKFAKALEEYGVAQSELKRISPVMYEVYFVPIKNNVNKKEKNNV